MEDVILIDNQNRTDFFRQVVLTNLDYWSEKVKANLTDVTALSRDRELIIRAISFAFEVEETWPALFDLINIFSPYMERTGYWEIWRRIVTRATEMARRAGAAAVEVKLLVSLARLSQRQSHFHEVITTYGQVIRVARQIGDAENRARAYSNLGFLYAERGDWWRAEILCCHALTIFEALDYPHGRAHTESHLGSLYTRQGRWDLAQCHFERAGLLWQDMGDHHGLMRVHINLGGLYCDMERPDEAMASLQKALSLAKLTGEEAETGSIYVNLSTAHRLRGEFVEAEAYAWQAEAICQRFDSASGVALAWDSLGLACIEQEKWSEAKLYLNTALEIWRKLDHKPGEIRNLVYWVGYELARGNDLQATRRLDEVTHLIKQHGLDERGPYWRSRLIEYSRRLAER